MKKTFLTSFLLGALATFQVAKAQNCTVTNSYNGSNIPSTFSVADPSGATDGTVTLSSTAGVQLTNLNTVSEGRAYTTLSSVLSNTNFSAECQANITAGNNPITVLMGLTSAAGQPWTTTAQNEIFVALTQPGSNAGATINIATSGSYIALYTKLAPSTGASQKGATIAIPASAIGNFKVRLVRKSATSVVLSAYNASGVSLGESCITIDAGIINLNTLQVATYTGHSAARYTTGSVNNFKIANNCIENQAPNPSVSIFNTCAYQSSPSTATLAAPAGYTNVAYAWYATNSTAGAPLATTQTYATASTTVGSVTVYGRYTATNNCGDAVVSNLVPVTLQRLVIPVNPSVSAPAAFCGGRVTPLTVSNAQAGVTYEWFNVATGGTAIGTGSTFTTPVLNASTSFWVLARSGSCITARTQVNVTVNPLPNATVTAPASVCSGAQVTISYNYGTGNAFTYTRATTYSHLGGGGGPGAFGETGTMSGTGTFSITATSPAGCVKAASVTVTVAASPAINLTGVPATACVGDVITTNVTYGASNNTVSFTKPPLANVNGAGWQGGFAEWGTLTTAGAYSYVLKVTSPVTNCSSTITKNITVNTPPATPTAGTPADKICKGETVQLTSNPTGGAWSVTPIGTSPVGPTVSSTGLFTGVTAGAYKVTYKVTNASGCSASANVNVAVGALPFKIDGPDNICVNSINTYTVLQDAVGNIYTWRRDGNYQSLIGTNSLTTADLTAGNPPLPSQIVLTAQGDFTCLDGTKRTAIVTKTVNYVANPSGVLIKCADGNCNTLTATNATGLTLRWYHYPSTGLQELGSGTSITNPKVSTTIRLDVTNSNGCKTTFYWTPFYTQTCTIVYDNNKPLDPNQGYTTGARLANPNSSKEYNLVAHPNPASDLVTFESDGLEGEATIFNSQGEVVEKLTLSLSQKLYDVKIANYASGMYYLQVYSANGKVYSTAIVKE